MSKSRTKRGLAKRVIITKSGHLKRKRAFRRHLLTKKSSKRKGNLRGNVIVRDIVRKVIALMMHT